MKHIQKTLLVIIGIFFSMSSNADTMAFNSRTDCSLLQQPKALLLVHASWCGACKKFLPVYVGLSKEPAYKNWMFYETTDNDWSSVCRVELNHVPVVFVNNLHELKHANQPGVLKAYLDNAANNKN